MSSSTSLRVDPKMSTQTSVAMRRASLGSFSPYTKMVYVEEGEEDDENEDGDNAPPCDDVDDGAEMKDIEYGLVPHAHVNTQVIFPKRSSSSVFNEVTSTVDPALISAAPQVSFEDAEKIIRDNNLHELLGEGEGAARIQI